MDFNLLQRRQFLRRSGLGLGTLALATLLRSGDGAQAAALPARTGAMFAPRAKRVIYLHMIGAPSQLDLYDHKPELNRRDGEECPASLLTGKRFAFLNGKM